MGSLRAVTLPLFKPGDDPGPAFPELLRRVGLDHRFDVSDPTDRLAIAHGTTVVAVKFDGGVIMAGDRRATAGNLISHRTMEKVFPADRWSGVAIAGAAGPAIEMVKLFQLQLEHYEKVEGQPLSLDGKANQLSAMVRGHLPAAMQGLVVVPIFAGYDRLRERGRLFAYDVTGGRYEEGDYTASGSGSLHARTVVKLGYRSRQGADEAVDLVLTALFQAADDDSATGGPDALRGIYPVVARIDADGYRRIDDGELAERFERVVTEYHGGTGGAEGGVAGPNASEGSTR